MMALSCGLLCKEPQFFFCKKTQYTSGCEYLAGIGDRGYKILKYNFSQETVDRKCKWIYNPDIVKNSLKSGRGSRKAAGIEDPGTVKKEEKMVIGKMENRKSKFRKCAAAALAVMTLASAGATLAFFTDREEKVNTFTVGNIDIQLEEPQWDPDKGRDITPDKEVPKDPQITNTGANDAYVFMEVSVPRSEVRTVNDDGSLSEVLMQDLFTYETNEGWTLMRKQSNGDSTTYYYAYTDADNTMKALKPEETTTPVFSSVKFINMTEGELEGKDISINVISRGIQTEDLDLTDPLDIYAVIVGGMK